MKGSVSNVLASLLLMATTAAPAFAFCFDLSAKKAQINRKIQNGVTSGRITPRELNKLQNSLAKYDAKEARYFRQHGRITDSDSVKLMASLSSIDLKVEYDLHNFDRMNTTTSNSRFGRFF